MININHLIIAAVLAIVLTHYVFPKMIYLMCEMILRFDQVIELSKGKMKEVKHGLEVRLVFLILYLVSWRIMIVLFLLIQMLSFIEILGGFVKN